MNIHSNYIFRILGLVAFILSVNIQAEPYLAFKTNNKCSACHTNPIGGGARNSYGAYYGTQMLPEVAGEISALEPGKLSDTFSLGGDLRLNYDQSNRDDQDAKSFNTQSAQLYFSVAPKNSKFAFYIDQQVAPGSSLNREAFVLTKLKGNNYIKAGKLMLPYGIRLEDDLAFIRQATQVNFDTSDNGVELGLEYSKAVLNFAITNGTSSTSNDDENFQFTARGEYLGDNWRMGLSAALNDAELGRRTMANVFGGMNIGGWVFLAELDRIQDEVADGEDDTVQLASFIEVNKEISKGYNLKLTSEYLDPNDRIDEDERTRHSLLLEYTPYAHLQLRSGVRIGEDIPQRDSGNFTDFFLQMHMYY